MRNGFVTVVDRIFDLQGLKVVNTTDGQVRQVPPGEAPDPTDAVLVHSGEPTFAVRFANEVATDSDLRDDVGLALRRAAHRYYDVVWDGAEDEDRAADENRDTPESQQGHVEWVSGPAVLCGVAIISVDTDGTGFSPQMIDTMVRILVEELTPTGVFAHIVVPQVSSEPLTAWRCSSERASE